MWRAGAAGSGGWRRHPVLWDVCEGWRVDLSQLAGLVVAQITLETDTKTLPGPWEIRYADIALVSVDGTVRPIFNRGKRTSAEVGAICLPPRFLALEH